MKTKKMSLADVQGKLSRAEMKNIMAGSGGTTFCSVNCGDPNTSCILDDGSTGHCQFVTGVLCCVP